MTDQQIDEFLEILAKSPTSARDMVRGLFVSHEAQAAPAVPSRLLQKLDASIAWLERGEVLPGTSACIGLDDIKTIRAMLAATPAAPSQPVTRPQNCGTSYCSCVECVCEPEPTGMPELHPVAHIELGDDSHDVVTLEAAKAYGEQCWKAGYKHGAWADKPAVNQQLTTEPFDELEARATLPTQRSSMDGLPKPFGYVSDGFADGLRFQHNPWPVEHTLLHSTMPVFSAAAVQQFKQDAERYRWLASSESVAMNAKSKDHQWAISDAWTTLEKLDADKALIDAAIDAAMAKGAKG